MPSVECQTSFLYPPPSSPPITHILLSYTTDCELYLALNAADALACVHIIPSVEYQTSFFFAPSSPPITHVLLSYTTDCERSLALNAADAFACVHVITLIDSNHSTFIEVLL